MREHFWFDIEGDNGTGKDALADRLVLDGWFCASRSPDAEAKKGQASSLTGLDKVSAFKSYNQFCAKLALDHPPRSFLVRYWPSTLAAGFADKIFSWADLETHADHSMRQLPAPGLILLLQCRLDVRRDRVKKRGLVPESLDDMSPERDDRYRKAVARLAECVGPKCWRNLETSELNIDQVYHAAQALLAEVRGKS
jgi:hypothetical protein